MSNDAIQNKTRSELFSSPFSSKPKQDTLTQSEHGIVRCHELLREELAASRARLEQAFKK